MTIEFQSRNKDNASWGSTIKALNPSYYEFQSLNMDNASQKVLVISMFLRFNPLIWIMQVNKRIKKKQFSRFQSRNKDNASFRQRTLSGSRVVSIP